MRELFDLNKLYGEDYKLYFVLLKTLTMKNFNKVYLPTFYEIINKPNFNKVHYKGDII